MKSLVPPGWYNFSEEERRDYTWLVMQEASNKSVSRDTLRKMSPAVLNAAIYLQDRIGEKIENDETGDKNE